MFTWCLELWSSAALFCPAVRTCVLFCGQFLPAVSGQRGRHGHRVRWPVARGERRWGLGSAQLGPVRALGRKHGTVTELVSSLSIVCCMLLVVCPCGHCGPVSLSLGVCGGVCVCVTQAFLQTSVGHSCAKIIWDPNTKKFKRTLMYFNTDTQFANVRLSSHKTTLKQQING